MEILLVLLLLLFALSLGNDDVVIKDKDKQTEINLTDKLKDFIQKIKNKF